VHQRGPIQRSVREGNSYIVTRPGRAIARLVPIDNDVETQVRARDTLLSRLEQQPVVHAGRWTRDERHEDEA
jgi:antitoxin (DNA-binding transcriptional repressor) of toxin-antitoxin stability system